MVVKMPPTKILPSACTASASTQIVRIRVERISQAGRCIEPGNAVARLSADAVRSLKVPPAKILPSVCTAIDKTVLFAFGLKAMSSVPSVFNRAMLLRAHAQNAGKVAADENLAVWLHGGG